MTDDLEAQALEAAISGFDLPHTDRYRERMRAAVAVHQRVMREGEKPGVEIEIDYTNWRGERAVRTIRPTGRLIQGPTEHHRDAPWLVEATDVAKGEIRTFDPANIHRWGDQRVMREGRPETTLNQQLTLLVRSFDDPKSAATARAAIHALFREAQANGK